MSGGWAINIKGFCGVALGGERIDARAAANDLPNRVSCRPGGAIYKGKHLDQLADTNLGTVGARVWNRTLDISKIARLW